MKSQLRTHFQHERRSEGYPDDLTTLSCPENFTNLGTLLTGTRSVTLQSKTYPALRTFWPNSIRFELQPDADSSGKLVAMIKELDDDGIPSKPWRSQVPTREHALTRQRFGIRNGLAVVHPCRHTGREAEALADDDLRWYAQQVRRS